MLKKAVYGDPVPLSNMVTPEILPDIGAGIKVSGTISDLCADFNSEVKKGQLLAKLDQALFLADVDQQTANVRTAEATLKDDEAAVASSQADLEKANVDVLDKEHKFKRQKELFDDKLISEAWEHSGDRTQCPRVYVYRHPAR